MDKDISACVLRPMTKKVVLFTWKAMKSSRLQSVNAACGFSWASPVGQRSFCCVVFGPLSLLSNHSAFTVSSRESYDESPAFVDHVSVCI